MIVITYYNPDLIIITVIIAGMRVVVLIGRNTDIRWVVLNETYLHVQCIFQVNPANIPPSFKTLLSSSQDTAQKAAQYVKISLCRVSDDSVLVQGSSSSGALL